MEGRRHKPAGKDGSAILGRMNRIQTWAFPSAFLASLSLGLHLQVAYTFTAESYPTRARASGFALSDGVGHLGGAAGALALPALVGSLGFGAGFALIGATGLAAGLIALAGPKSSRLTLEQISR